ncbi:MAG: hypothetical protein U9R75_07470 [Candidatus Thermoplasmatota archaeon]|nr:hypothetical protein [Candidatus Thermoplasmatota archaeon]
MKVWEMDDIPQPNEVHCDSAHYHGQKYVEQLLKIINQKAFMNNEERFLDPFFSIIKSSLEQGVEDEGTIQWDDRSHYTKISWTGYSWKLPPDLKKRIVQIDISKVGEHEPVGKIKISLRKMAENKGDILISPKIISKLNLRNGNVVNVKIQFCH